MSHRWDPERYLAYADERGRPFVDLLARVGADRRRAAWSTSAAAPATSPRCWRERWPGADVLGVDSSPEMVEPAARPAVAGVRLRAWATCATGAPAEPVDVLVSNATLQWVPGHLDLLPRLVGQVAPGGWFAFQVPGNFDEPSHVLLPRAGRRPAVRALHRGRGAAARPRPGGVPRRAARPRLRGGRLGDDVPARAARRGPGVHLDQRHRCPADAAGAARRPAGFEASSRARGPQAPLPFRAVVAQVPHDLRGPRPGRRRAARGRDPRGDEDRAVSYARFGDPATPPACSARSTARCRTASTWCGLTYVGGDGVESVRVADLRGRGWASVMHVDLARARRVRVELTTNAQRPAPVLRGSGSSRRTSG